MENLVAFEDETPLEQVITIKDKDGVSKDYKFNISKGNSLQEVINQINGLDPNITASLDETTKQFLN